MVVANQRGFPRTIQIEAVDPSVEDPPYVQVLARLQQAIAVDELTSGQLLPSERQLCGLFRVSRVTLRRALDELVRSGRLVRLGGIGTFVADQRLRLGESLSFTDRVGRAGLTPSSVVVSFGVVPPIALVNGALQVGVNEKLLHLKRVRTVDRRPVMVQSSYLSARRFKSLLDEDMATRSLYRSLLDRFGVQVQTVQETLRASLMLAEEAALLGCAAGSPALEREFLALDLRGRPVEYCLAWARGDSVSYRFTVREGEGPAVDMVVGPPPTGNGLLVAR